jgi:hypothetical protein
MKWNFECESRRRDYLLIPFVARCNDFCLPDRYASLETRDDADDLNRFAVAQHTKFIERLAARRSLLAH